MGTILGEGVVAFAAEVGRAPGGLVVGVAVADVEDFAKRLGAVAVVFEVLREGDGVGLGLAKVGRQVVYAERLGTEAGEERIAGRGADRLIAIGGVEADALGGEAVDVRGDRVWIAVAGNVRLQVVDADEEDIRACGVSAGGGNAMANNKEGGENERQEAGHRLESQARRRLAAEVKPSTEGGVFSL